ESAAEAIAVTVDNGVLPSDCITNASQIARKIGIEHEIIKENLIEDESFISNPPHKCYICKNKIYNKLEEFSSDNGFDAIVDGTNISDLLEDRPGIMVNYQKKILTPLIYAGMTAEEVRNILKHLNIKYSNSTTCYATRIPTGSEITTKKINRIGYAETMIKNITGIDLVRVRDDDDLARIEVLDLDKILDKKILSHINSELTSVGFKKVTLDISNYGNGKKELVFYKPCKDEANKIMFETELLYSVNIEDTCRELENLGKVKCSNKMGVAMLEVEGKNITIFNKGKIVARRIKDKEDAQDMIIKVLPLIRREI
ncbi:MAG: ATP-dependent sacrificial sulfur transferase LarE, partial [Methanobacterium sp.]|nr:ATP-dependent sacrificial sulfur transferase LarE [Methanobacterium sp.]